MYTKYKREKDLSDYRKAKLADNTLPNDFGPGQGGAGGAGGASGGASGGVKLSMDEQKATANKIYSSLLDKGYNTNAAAGITGNLWHESGGFGGGSGDSGTAHGIAQWRGDRWAKMQEYAKSVGKDPNDLNTQVDYLDKELKTDYKSAYNLLQHASDVKTATGIFADQVEKPAGSGKGNIGGISGMSNRLNFASQVANFGGGAIGTSVKPMSAASRIKALSGGPQASLGATPPQVATAAPYMGAPPPETEIGEDTTSTALGSGEKFASADEDDDSQDGSVMGAASGGMIKGYATGGAVEEPDFTGVEKGVNTNYDPAFRKSLLNLQQRATTAGIKTKLISGVRTLNDQKELYANFLAGQSGKPLPFPKRGPVKVAAKPGTSPHEAGRAADLLAVDPKQQGALDKLASSDPNLQTVAGDPGHYQLNSGGKGGAPSTAVASAGAKPPPPIAPEEQPEEDLASASSSGGEQPEERGQGNSQAVADATERGRANQAYMASEAQYDHQKLMQEGATNQAALDQEAAVRSTPPPPAQAAQPQEAEGARRGGLIRGYAPGGVVDATGYIAPDTATLSSASKALAPAVAAASQATPAVPTTPAATTPAATTPVATAPAATAPAAQSPDDTRKALQAIMYLGGMPAATAQGIHKATPDYIAAWGKLSPDQQKWMTYNPPQAAVGSPARAMQNAGYGDWSVLDPSLGVSSHPSTAMQQPAASSVSTVPTAPVITGSTRGSVWNPTTKAWEAGAGYAGGGSVRGYADGGDVLDDDTDEAVPTAPAPVAAPVAAPAPAPVAAPAPAQPTPTGDARTRASAPGMTDPGAAPAAPVKPETPPPNLVADALHDGLVHLTKMFGLDKTGAVQDPDAEARIQAFNNGAGAADGEAMHAVHRAVDPNHQMTQQELASASVAALKVYYDSKGQPEAGAKAIGEIMQHQKAVSAHYSATAAQAFQQGDVQTGLKFLKAAYDQVPDGQHIDAMVQQDGTVAYRLTDSSSGRVIHQGTANAQQLAKLAQVGSTGTPYVKAVATSAARAKTPTVPGGATPTPPPRPADLGGAAPAVDTGSGPSTAPAGAPVNDGGLASTAPAGGSGAYLAQREAALTSGVTPGAVDTGPRYAQADTGSKTDATVDGANATAITPEAKAAARAAIGGGDEPAPAEAPVKIAPAPPGKPAGLLSPGNIDLAHRPIYKQPNGQISTVNSMGIEEGGKQILIPTIVNGKQVSKQEAIQHYHDTGENLGKFDTVDNANQYAQDLHRAQAEFYKSGGAPPDEAVDTGRKPIVPVPDTPLVTPKDSRVTPTKVPEPVIPDRLTKPVEPEVRKADQKDLPDVAPVTPRNVSDDYDLTPRKFDVPQPNPDDYFDTYKRTAARYPHGNTAVRKALVTMYSQANTAFDNAMSAWNGQKAQFETEEGKRLSSENERAGRGQTIENTTSSEQFDLDKEKRKEVLTSNEKAQERQDKLADEQAAQQAGLNEKEVARIVKRNEDDRAAARAGDAEAQKRLDKTADDLVAQKRENDKRAQDQAIQQNKDAEAANAKAAEEDAKRQAEVDKEYRGHTWENDKIAEAQFQKDKEAATIKPPSLEEQKAIDEQLAEIPKKGGKADPDAKSPLDELYSSFIDPYTQQPYPDQKSMRAGDQKSLKPGIGPETVNGLRELTGHLIHANGLTADAAVDIVTHLTNSDPDHPDKEYFKVAPKLDKAGNVLVKVPGYQTIKISPEMAEAADEMRASVRQHLINVQAQRKVNEGVDKAKSEIRAGQFSGAVDTGISGGKGVASSVYKALFPDVGKGPAPLIQTRKGDAPLSAPAGPLPGTTPIENIPKSVRDQYPPHYFGD